MRTAFSSTAPAANSAKISLYAIRHAKPDVPQGLVYGLDVPIVPMHVQDVMPLAAQLPDNAAWVSSTARRAMETIFLLQQAKGVERADLRLQTGFVEQSFGDWTDKTHAALSADPQSGFRAYMANLDDGSPPNGESLNAMAQRVLNARDNLAAELAASAKTPSLDVVLVCHGGPIRALWAEATGKSVADVVRNTDRTFACGYLSLTRIDLNVENGVVTSVTPVSVRQFSPARHAAADKHLF